MPFGDQSVITIGTGSFASTGPTPAPRGTLSSILAWSMPATHDVVGPMGNVKNRRIVGLWNTGDLGLIDINLTTNTYTVTLIVPST